ncbi:MAG: aminotransferase class I/II-fold pyridoxal phosphate-dependent enzyme, partial [Myxococcota bacterium]
MVSTKDTFFKKPKLNRRSFLGGTAAGSTVAWFSCTHPASVRQSASNAAQKSVLPPDLFGPAADIAQLSRNENPYGPSPRVYQAVTEATRSGAYYASPAYLQAMIAERHGIEPQQVTISHGSGEALCAVALAWGQKGAIIAPDLFWDTTALYAVRQGVELRRVSMTAELEVDLKKLEAAIDDRVALVHLCNPNNPTG